MGQEAMPGPQFDDLSTAAISAVVFGAIHASVYFATKHGCQHVAARELHRVALHSSTGVFSVIASTLALLVVISSDEGVRHDVFAHSRLAHVTCAIVVGFFVFELTAMCTWRSALFGWQSLVHGVLTMCVFAVAQSPFNQYWTCVTLLLELSTPFLMTWRVLVIVVPNFAMAIDKCRRAFAAVFIVVRILFAIPYSIIWWSQMAPARAEGQTRTIALLYGYLAVAIFMHCLNLWWFSKIAAAWFKETKLGRMITGFLLGGKSH